MTQENSSRRRFLKTSGALGAAAGFSFLPSLARYAEAAEPNGAPIRGGILYANVVPEAPGWVAGLNISNPAVVVSVSIFDGLIGYDAQLNPVPQLAESWTQTADGKTITFKLRQGVTWHDGQPFTSADVQYSLMEVTKKVHPRGNATFARLDAVDTPDAHTAIFRFNTATPAVWSALWGGETQILPKHLYAGTDPLTNPWNAKPIGTGPFVFKEWARGSHVALERNPNYWDKGADGRAKPYLDKVLFRFIPDAGAREASLENGELQFAATDAVPVADLPRLAKDPALVIDTKSWEALAPIAFFDFNMRRKTFQDIRVRRAIAHAIDRNALAKIVWFGYATPATGPIPSYQTKFYKADTPQYPYDPKRAEELLDAAGLKRGANGIRLSINNLPLPFGDQYVRTAEFIRDQLRRVGIELKLINYDLPTFGIKAYREYDFDTITNWYSAFPDPQLGVIRRYWSRAIKPGTTSSNASGWSSPEMDRVIEAMQVETDPVRRRAQIDQLQVIAQTEVPSVNLLEPKLFSIRSARVQGYKGSPFAAYQSLAGLWLEPAK
jgi:peptide/nickel transport system substrate-binding protein